MLFLKQPETADDIRAFCAHFNEGIRVEYKANFDENVRRKLPKVVSSFANSLGGVLILGINAPNGIPQVPIEGFEPAERDEIPLTIENLCLQNIHPAVFPRITEILSDVKGRKFFVVEVDESVEAPHAIENSTLVYVRTGNAANPFELAKVDSVIELLRRRENPLQTRHQLLKRAFSRPFTNNITAPQVRFSIGPSFPQRPLCSPVDSWNFLYNTGYRGGHFFPSQTLRRIENGVISVYAGSDELGEINNYGFVMGKMVIPAQKVQAANIRSFSDVFHFCLRIYSCAASFLNTIGFRGEILIEVRLLRMAGQAMPFLGVELAEEVEQYRCFESDISASLVTASEHLRSNRLGNLQELFVQLCWSLWQGGGDFPEGALRATIAYILEPVSYIGIDHFMLCFSGQ